MPKPGRKQPIKPVTTAQDSSRILLVGVVCLAIGLAIGYFFGKGSNETQSLVPSQTQNQTSGGPSSFMPEEASLKATLLTNPNDLNSLIELGNLYYDHDQFSEAIEYYGRALTIDPRNPNVRTDRGTSYWRIGQADAAIDEFKKSLEIDPVHTHTLYNLGFVYLKGKNNPAEARQAWERLLAADPNYPERATVEQQLKSLPTETSPAGANASPDANMQDLLQRLKKK